MTKTAAAAIAVLSSFAIMILMCFQLQLPSSGMHPMAGMWSEPGWPMALGPIAMLLFFGGILTLIVLLTRSFPGKNKD